MGRKAYETFTCSCGERCVMVPSESTGNLAPITVRNHDGGNVELVFAANDTAYAFPKYRIVAKVERETDPKPRRLNHDATCPDADGFRK